VKTCRLACRNPEGVELQACLPKLLKSGAAGLPAETPKEWSCRESNPGPEKMNVYVLHA